MSKRLLYRGIPLLTVVFLFATLVTPAFADGNSATVVDISDAIKEVSYTDDDVYVTYDVPLDPYSSIYGLELGSDTLTHILDSTYIQFTQDGSQIVTFFTSMIEGSFSLIQNSSGFWTKELKTLPVPDTYEELYLITHFVVDGVYYEISSSSHLGSTYCVCNYDSVSRYPSSDGEYRLRFDVVYNAVLFDSAAGGTYEVAAGYYESKEIWASEYDSISGITYPLGYSPTDISGVKVIDVSDLRSGSSFDVTFDYRFAAEFEGTVSGGALKFFAYFLDENGDFLNTVFLDQLDFTATSTSSSYSSTFTLPEDAAYFFIQVQLQELNVIACKSYEFVMSSLELTVPVSAVEYNSKQMDEINTKLEELKNQQQETNDKLDEIITGTPGANAGADNMQGVAGDYKDQVNNQLQNGQSQLDKLDQLPRPDVSGAVTLPEWAASDQFLGFNAVVATIWENETIYEIMVVASILMLASYILFGKKV